jgi:hypothetical protein
MVMLHTWVNSFNEGELTTRFLIFTATSWTYIEKIYLDI